MKREHPKRALILVDIQNDFCPGGSLAVRDGDQVVKVVNQLMPAFSLIVATQDWHPANHTSFKEFGGNWPPHCIQNTCGADFHKDLDRERIDIIVRKGASRDAEAYSGFDGITEQGSSLDEVLRSQGIDSIYITGLATDYCVRATALDGLKKSYEVFIVEEAIRAVDVNVGDGTKAITELSNQGASIVTSEQVIDRSQVANA